MYGWGAGRSLMSHRLSGDASLRDCLHPQLGESKWGKCLCNCDCYYGDPRGAFQGHLERQWLMISRGESWTPRQADPTSRQGEPTCPFNSCHTAGLASGCFRMVRQEPGSPGGARADPTFKVLPPTVLVTHEERSRVLPASVP